MRRLPIGLGVLGLFGLVGLVGCKDKAPEGIHQPNDPPAASVSASATTVMPTVAASTSAAPSSDLAGDHPGDSFAGSTFGYDGLGMPGVGSTGTGMAYGGDPNPSKVKMTEAGVVVTGKLPPEVIKRIVRANYPRFRRCYEAGLKSNPAMKGTVTVRFVIDTSGAVESAKDDGGTLVGPTARACVVGIYNTLSFPEPEDGKVTVTYPIDFAKP